MILTKRKRYVNLKKSKWKFCYIPKRKKKCSTRTRDRHNTHLETEIQSCKIDHQIPFYLLFGAPPDHVQSLERLGAKLPIAITQLSGESCQCSIPGNPTDTSLKVKVNARNRPRIFKTTSRKIWKTVVLTCKMKQNASVKLSLCCGKI